MRQRFWLILLGLWTLLRVPPNLGYGCEAWMVGREILWSQGENVSVRGRQSRYRGV